MKKKLAVLAIGGNAVNKPGEKPTAENMFRNIQVTARFLAGMLKEDYDLVITHGNGPQVGNLLVQQDLAKETIPPFPIDVNDAQTQGSLGYAIAQMLGNELLKAQHFHPVCPVITQIVVDPNDPAFDHPTKPVGPFYAQEEAQSLHTQKGWVFVEDAGRGWRRVVPSPKPLDIVEVKAIKALLEAGILTIAAGGGGIPVERLEDGTLRGVEAVIDKDRASALLAAEIQADELIILTGVDQVCLDFGKPTQRALDKITVEEAKRLAAEGHFPKGSMGPKIEAAIDFVRQSGNPCLITSMEQLESALHGKTGTVVVP
ncbi:MAG TPA: carbamate kinase [Thermotogota bacterium]|nr:carbamate kinase [Thermotogota bacterium]HRW91598.1 carbamate kinase [Thermotogota bacterium]